MNAENSERAGNNRGGGDSGITNEEDLCLPSIEPFGNLRNLSSETEKNTPFPLKEIDQALFDDEFFDIDNFLRLPRACGASSASEKSQLRGGAAQPPVKQSSLSRMSNPTLRINDESMTATATSEVWDSSKRKADTVNMNEGSRVHGKAIFTSTSTCLIILQNSHSKFSIIPVSISQLSNQPSNLVMSGTRIQTSRRSGSPPSWVGTTPSVRRRMSVQISAHVSIVVGTSENSKRLNRNRRYRRGQNRH